MDAFTDYYTLLGVEADASPGAIKAAFKKLALQYHPDVYKGADAHERMRLLLLAYQTLNNPVTRRQYDAERSEHVQDGRATPATPAQRPRRPTPRPAASSARRDRQRHYDFPDFQDGRPLRIDLIDIVYTLTPTRARLLVQQGMLRGVAPETPDHAYYCHRCHHHWDETLSHRRQAIGDVPDSCPECHAVDWMDYLLLRCVHCSAIFESEQIRYKIGSYAYGKGHPGDLDALCPPYELFPLCPYCGTARWCPAEDARVREVRRRAAQRAARLRMLWISIAVVAVVVVGIVALGLLR